MNEIRFVEHRSWEYWQTVELRYDILRVPLGLEFTFGELRAEDQHLHLAYFENGALLGCLVLVPLENGYIKMRQVAVAENQQGKRIGTKMVQSSEKWAANNGYTTMECNARDVAIKFYEKQGWHKVGDEFIEVSIPHYKMEKVFS